MILVHRVLFVGFHLSCLKPGVNVKADQTRTDLLVACHHADWSFELRSLFTCCLVVLPSRWALGAAAHTAAQANSSIRSFCCEVPVRMAGFLRRGLSRAACSTHSALSRHISIRFGWRGLVDLLIRFPILVSLRVGFCISGGCGERRGDNRDSQLYQSNKHISHQKSLLV